MVFKRTETYVGANLQIKRSESEKVHLVGSWTVNWRNLFVNKPRLLQSVVFNPYVNVQVYIRDKKDV
jgi:hypothetical protein